MIRRTPLKRSTKPIARNTEGCPMEPLYAPDPPPDWDDLLIAATDDLRDAWRLNRDDRALERKLRLECIERAETAISDARALLVAEAAELERRMATYAG